MTPHVIEPQIQRGAMDCGVACVAMLSGVSYPEVSEMARLISPVVHRSGLWTTEVRQLAEAVQCPLRVRRTVPDDGTGILCVKGRKRRDAHFAVLFQGVLVDPANGQVWDLDTYLDTGGWRVIGFLEPV